MPYRLALLLLLFTSLPAAALEVRVVLTGVSGAMADNVRSFLSVEREKGRKGLSVARLRLLYKEAPAEIRKALQPFGYFKPRIDPRFQQQGPAYVLTYRIEPGPRIRVGKVDYQVHGPGRADPVFTAPFPITAGSELNQAAYDNAKQALLAGALEHGYLDARYTLAQVRVDLDHYSASIHLHLDTGVRYHFGSVRFLQDKLDPAFLARYLPFRPGDPFSQEELLALQSTLIDTEYFSQVEVRSRRDQAADGRVPVDVMLSPNKANRYRAGIGFSTDTGPRLSADWTRRRIGREGHRMTTELRLAQPQSTFKSEYLIPLQRPAKDSLSFTLQADRYDTDTRVGTTFDLNSAWSVGLPGDWRRTVAADYSYEDVEVGSGSTSGTTHHLIPSVKWSRLRSDGKEFSQYGSRLTFDILGAAQPLLSSSSFLQLHSNEKFIYGFGNWRFLGRAELGATWAPSLQDVPATKRFFAGGDNSVRGFVLDQIGPTDNAGNVVGGRYLAVGSTELERHLVGKWSAAVFVDAGNAFDPDYGNRLEYSVGVGVRWHSPVGPVRVDLASALSRDGNPLRLHLVVGPEL